MKERLTGAIILVALMVLLVPELLTGPVRSTARAAAVVSPAEGAPLRAYTINLADEARARGARVDASGPQPPAPLPASAQSLALASPAVATDSPPPPAPAPTAPAVTSASQSTAASADATAPSPAAAGSAEGFMVQLGSFASRANAERLARQVSAQGFQASVSQGASGRRLYRVRVGPARDHAAASTLAQQLRSAGHSGSIVPR